MKKKHTFSGQNRENTKHKKHKKNTQKKVSERLEESMEDFCLTTDRNAMIKELPTYNIKSENTPNIPIIPLIGPVDV